MMTSSKGHMVFEKHLTSLTGDHRLDVDYRMRQVLELGDGTWLLLIRHKEGGRTVLLNISKDGSECISAVHDGRIQCIGLLGDNVIAIAYKSESQKSYIEVTSIIGSVSMSVGTFSGYETSVRSMHRLRTNPNPSGNI